jgi:hypothetical protein
MYQTKIEPTLQDLQVTVESQTAKLSELVNNYDLVDISPFSTAIKNVLGLCDARLKAIDLNDWKLTALLTLDISTPYDCDALRQTLRIVISEGSLYFEQTKFSKAILRQFSEHLEFTEAVLFRFQQIAAQKSAKDVTTMPVAEELQRSSMLKNYFIAVRRMLTDVLARFPKRNESEQLEMIQAFWDLAFVQMLLDAIEVAAKILWDESNSLLVSPRKIGAFLSSMALTEVTEAVLIQTEKKVEY